MQYRELHGYKYQLVADYELQTGIMREPSLFQHSFTTLGHSGVLCVKKGYAWDGSTVVRDTVDSMTASLVHDALYQSMRMGLLDRSYRKHADRLYRDMCIRNGMNRVFAYIRYAGLRLLAGGGVKRDSEEEQVITI